MRQGNHSGWHFLRGDLCGAAFMHWVAVGMKKADSNRLYAFLLEATKRFPQFLLIQWNVDRTVGENALSDPDA